MLARYLVLASALIACQKAGASGSVSEVPASVACDTLDRGSSPVQSTEPGAIVRPAPTDYLPAGPISVGDRSQILWRVSQDMGESIAARDGAGGVFLVPDGRAFLDKLNMARVDRTGKWLWSRSTSSGDFLFTLSTATGIVGPVRRDRDGVFDALGFMDRAGRVEYLELGSYVHITSLAIGADGSFGVAGTVGETYHVGTKVFGDIGRRHSLVGMLTAQRKTAWVVGVEREPSAIAVVDRSNVLYIAKDEQSGRKGVYSTQGGTPTRLGWLPECVEDKPTILANTGRVYVVGATCGPKGAERLRPLTGFRLENGATYRDWGVDSLPADDEASDNFSSQAWARVEPDGQITLVTISSIYGVSTDASATVTRRVALTANERCPGDPRITSVAFDQDSAFTTTICVNATKYRSAPSTVILTRYALH